MTTKKTKTSKGFTEDTAQEAAPESVGVNMGGVDMYLRQMALNYSMEFFKNEKGVARVTATGQYSTGMVIAAAQDFYDYLETGKMPGQQPVTTEEPREPLKYA